MEEDIFDSSLLADSSIPSEEYNSTEMSQNSFACTLQNSFACTSFTATKIPVQSLLSHFIDIPSATMFGISNSFNPLQIDPLRFLINRSLNATVLNPILTQSAVMLTLQQQLSKYISSTLIQPNHKSNLGCAIRSAEKIRRNETSSTAQLSFDRKRNVNYGNNLSSISTTPKRSKLLIDEILDLRSSESYQRMCMKLYPTVLYNRKDSFHLL